MVSPDKTSLWILLLRLTFKVAEELWPIVAIGASVLIIMHVLGDVPK